MIRPSELETFFIKYGKPLEVGMAVKTKATNQEFEVINIRLHRKSKKAYINIVNENHYIAELSPLELEPIL